LAKDPKAVGTAPPSGGAWRAWCAWLDAPLSGWSCVLGWCAATAVFLLFIDALGGFSATDSYESVYTTWALANGHAACAFPHGFNVTAPLYPLLSAGGVALEHVGRGTPFPAVTPGHCNTAFIAIDAWSHRTDALVRTLQVGLLAWLAFQSGAIALLRAIGRGRCRWEPATLLLLACLPPVWSCLQSTFHPEDLLALGLALWALACALRRSWGWAGALVGLAVLTQQYALLIAVPLFFIAPPLRRAPYALAASAMVGLVALPLVIVTSGSAAHAIFLGTGASHGIGGALVSQLHLHGWRVVLVSRVVPLVVSGAVAWWAARRLGSRVRAPVVMLSLVAFSLALRLVFEQQLFEYYFMALSVVLVLLDVAQGRLRAWLVAWLGAVPMVCLTELSGIARHEDLIRLGVLAAAGIVLVRQKPALVPTANRLPWIALIACTLLSWSGSSLLGATHPWLWQLVLVSWGLCLAAQPLLHAMRTDPTPLLRTVALRPEVPRFARVGAVASR
jgi:Glycosyltransferase family 87